MFSEVDSIIFPDGCEVIEVASQHFVYPIFKCGRSSLVTSMESKNWKFVPAQEITQIKTPITVFLRDPKQRFLSGVNTYLQHLESQRPGLDQNTVLFFVNQYLFLNRHYMPQFFWLINLARHTSIDTRVTLCGINEISKLTEVNHHAEIKPLSDELRAKIESFDWSKLELYFFLDQILLNQIGQTMSIGDLIKHVKNKHVDVYNLVFQKSFDILNALS